MKKIKVMLFAGGCSGKCSLSNPRTGECIWNKWDEKERWFMPTKRCPGPGVYRLVKEKK